MATAETPDTAVCTCSPGSGCDGEGYEPDDPRTCPYCLTVDGEQPCPADPAAYDATIEGLMDAVAMDDFEPNVVCADGSEPFASLDLGGGLWLDLTAKLRRAGSNTTREGGSDRQKET